MNRLSGIAALVAVLSILSTSALSQDGSIKGWHSGAVDSPDYVSGLGQPPGRSGKPAAFLRAKISAPSGFGQLMQDIKPDAYVGGRVRLTANIRTIDAGHAVVWISDGNTSATVDIGGKTQAGTTDWKRYELVTDVSDKSKRIQFGIALTGKGTIWADSFSLDPVSKDVPLTSRAPAPVTPSAPVNLNFEQ